MYLQQFKEDQNTILKYLPFVLGFLGFMALNIVSSLILNVDSEAMITASINQWGRNVTFFTFLLPFVFFMILLFLWWKMVHKKTMVQLTTARSKIDYKRIGFSFTIWIVINLIVLFISYLLDPTSLQLNFNLHAFIPLFLVAIIFIPIQTSFEEYFFRGYFLQFTAFVSKNRFIALISTSVIFGLMHISNPEVSDMGPIIMIFYIGCGITLGIMTLMDDGLELALGFHAANNLLGALLVTNDSAVFQTDAIFKSTANLSINELLIQVFVIFPILLYIFTKKYNWAHWKQKLFKSI